MRVGIIRYFAILFVLSVLRVSTSIALITVNFNALNFSYVTDSTGPVNYLNGDLVEVGTFASAPTVGSSSLAGFAVFGSTLTSDGSFSKTQNGSDSGFASNQIYLVVFNAPTAGAATELAIAYVNNSYIHDPPNEWIFPGSLSVPNTTSIELDNLFASPGASASLAAGASIIYGTAGLDPAGY